MFRKIATIANRVLQARNSDWEPSRHILMSDVNQNEGNESWKKMEYFMSAQIISETWVLKLPENFQNDRAASLGAVPVQHVGNIGPSTEQSYWLILVIFTLN